MELYTRDFKKGPTVEEQNEFDEIIKREKEGKTGKFVRINLYNHYPEAIRHYKSLFPNNHIDLIDCKDKIDLLTDSFSVLVHDEKTTERDILNFINHKPAHFIIGSLLINERFGRHGTYIFPEFSIGNGKYYADYLVVGKNSGGYEFMFVELEAPNGSTTIKNGYAGKATRAGLNQIDDWKIEIEGNYSAIADEFKKLAKDNVELPREFIELDTTRMHYVEVVGLRKDYEAFTYTKRRRREMEQNIISYHYDNLIDFSRSLESRNSF